MLAHPFIHEAAIAGGQFFSAAGLYIAFLALQNQSIENRKLLLASVLWACAIATRITQIVPIALMVLVTWLYVFKEYRKTKSVRTFAGTTASLIGPLVICGILLAWYNWARFDSIFEFGLYYQLAALNLQANYSALFSRVYVVQNIYNYFFNPFEIRGNFPFAYPLPGSEKSILAAHELPRLYAVEGKFPGLLNSTPFLIFAIVPLLLLALKFFRSFKTKQLRADLLNRLDWTVISLITSFVGGSIPTLLIFYVGFRYETEFITGLLMLGLIGFCQSLVVLKNRVSQRAIAVIGISLMLFSILANIVLAFTGVVG
jgi:hypothetical protein